MKSGIVLLCELGKISLKMGMSCVSILYSKEEAYKTLIHIWFYETEDGSVHVEQWRYEVICQGVIQETVKASDGLLDVISTDEVSEVLYKQLNVDIEYHEDEAKYCYELKNDLIALLQQQKGYQ